MKHVDFGKHVEFGQIEIRLYSVVMGDHPGCAMGCPLSLGWEYEEEGCVPIDDYEVARDAAALSDEDSNNNKNCRRRKSLRITPDERRRRITEGEGISERDIRRANRRLQREREGRCRTRVNAESAAFFRGSEL